MQKTLYIFTMDKNNYKQKKLSYFFGQYLEKYADQKLLKYGIFSFYSFLTKRTAKLANHNMFYLFH